MKTNSNVEYRKYTVEYAQILVPKELRNVPSEICCLAIPDYVSLGEGIEITRDNIIEFNLSSDYNNISKVWQDFLTEISSISCDNYILHD